MSTELPFKKASEVAEGGFHLDRIKLLAVMAQEISSQVPGIGFEARLYNALVRASNAIADEFAKPIVKATPGMGLEAWLNSDDTGSSSLFMAWILSSGQFGIWQGREQPEHAYPHDPDDLGRCIRLVRAVPRFAFMVYRMQEHGKQWAAVVENWERWAKLYDDENDDGSQLYAEMKAAYGEE